MTNEEFQKLMLEKFSSMEANMQSMQKELTAIRREMATKDDIARLDAKIDAVKSELKADIAALDAKVEQYGYIQQQDVYHLLQHIDKKLDNVATKDDMCRLEAKIDKIIATQTIQGESINILAMRQLHTESELAAFKQAK
ncbi:conserved hypothetical protein [Thermosinus carboxydivorans Nor1]|uniref:Uncharacterized protein n=1 Tax=Thermosinus carboxydivorans Nor1 TaxID=401526 RepID=A1HRE7_9FIRM|nr:hypothetical protein [Thermosinus carboxydivorans]EAX47462.1 conserved hypothetical protein [Thermosinus carboxydivorans Nor1]